MAARSATPKRARCSTGDLWRAVATRSKLDPRWQLRNPVMFIVEVGALASLLRLPRRAQRHKPASTSRSRVAVVHRALRQLRRSGRRRPRQSPSRFPAPHQSPIPTRAARRRRRGERRQRDALRKGDRSSSRPASSSRRRRDRRRRGDVDESAITGESAPVIREAGGDRSSVTGGTRVLSDRIVVRRQREPRRVVPRPHDLAGRRRAAPEDAQRDRALDPARRLTIIFLIAVATLAPFSIYAGAPSVVVLIALLVCLIPTTIGGLLSAIGIAGMDRVLQRNVLAMSGRAVEAAGDVDTLLLDKTGTITLGNRQATEIILAPGVDAAPPIAPPTSRRWPTRRPKAARSCARARGAGRGGDGALPAGATFVPFSAYTRMSGVDFADGGRKDAQRRAGRRSRLGRRTQAARRRRSLAATSNASRAPAARRCCSPNNRVLGRHLPQGHPQAEHAERFDRLRAMGIRTVMITGDNPLTAARSRAKPASTTSSPRRRPRRRWR
jgi:K+-transporting ATPase ATPase B chain